MGVPFNLSFDEKQYRFDYLGFTDGNPAYQGMAPRGIAEGDLAWTIYFWEYDANRQATKRTLAYKASWTNRATTSYG